MDDRQRRAWQALELGPVWRLRDELPDAESAPAPAALAAAARQVAELDWTALQVSVSGCQTCGLSRSRTRTVFGNGAAPAEWMLVGHAPGAEDDAGGVAFSGQAGRLLDQMLAAIGVGLDREAFATHIVKCRPTGDRDLKADEASACRPYLSRQAELVRPRLVVALGAAAARSLLGTDDGIEQLRGRVHRLQIGEREVPLVVTFHPADLLRRLGDKAGAWADLCLARRVHRLGFD